MDAKRDKSASESEEAPLNERGEKEGAGLTPTKHLKFRIVHLSGCHRKTPMRLKDKRYSLYGYKPVSHYQFKILAYTVNQYIFTNS